MQKITPHLWFDKEAREAAKFYTTVFKDVKTIDSTTIHDTPSGDSDIVTIEVFGQQFILISAGPYFKLNPSVSFLVACSTKEEVDELWGKISVGGKALMELGEYPFSARYGWTEDKFGVSWQIMYSGEMPIQQKITPAMMFVGEQCGKAEEAIKLYTSVFHNAKVGQLARYEEGDGVDKPGTIKYGDFILEGQHFAAMDSALEHKFAFTEAISFLIHCETQEEIDYYWSKLSAVPEAEQCGWLKDKFGFSWQVHASIIDRVFQENIPDKSAKITQAFLKMKKLDIAQLKEAIGE